MARRFLPKQSLDFQKIASLTNAPKKRSPKLLIFSSRIFNRFCPKEWPFRPSYTRNDHYKITLNEYSNYSALLTHDIPQARK
jgi:hypothetical protein